MKTAFYCRNIILYSCNKLTDEMNILFEEYWDNAIINSIEYLSTLLLFINQYSKLIEK